MSGQQDGQAFAGDVESRCLVFPRALSALPSSRGTLRQPGPQRRALEGAWPVPGQRWSRKGEGGVEGAVRSAGSGIWLFSWVLREGWDLT